MSREKGSRSIDDRRGLGQYGEGLAARHLVAKGYEIVDRNWRCEAGEMDLVARTDDCLAFVEVRTRRGRAMGTPEESITTAKKARLITLSEAYVQEVDWQGDWRIDVIAIELDPRGQVQRLEHYENAIGG